jgi:dienelactone hydrolase
MFAKIKLLTLAFAFILAFALFSCTNGSGDNANETDSSSGNTAQPESETPDTPETPSDIVLSFMDKFTKGDIAGANALSDALMQNADLGRVLEIHNFVRGEIIDFSITDYKPQEDLLLFDVAATHTLGAADYRVVLNAGGEISGFGALGEFISNAEPAEKSPSYISEPVIGGAGTKWPLNGILTLPAGADEKAPVPAVVLVHGSGPHDMDSTFSGTRGLFDIADFLAENGIAAIRYDKRTFAHGAKFVQSFGNSATVWEETIEDAVLAAEILRADPRVGEVYMLGWSLGGMLAPRIHASGGDFDGLIIFAGSARPLMDITYDQFMAEIAGAIELYGELPELTAAMDQLESLVEIAASIPDMTDEKAKNTLLPLLNVSAYYIKDMLIHPFESYIKDIAVPVMVMQGHNDYQVLAEVDYKLLQELLGARGNASFKLYDGLDHFFMPSIAANFSEHRDIIGLRPPGTRIAEQVLGDIADWVHAR